MAVCKRAPPRPVLERDTDARCHAGDVCAPIQTREGGSSVDGGRVVADVMVCVNMPLLVMRRALTMIRGKSESVVDRLMNPNTSVDLTDR